MHIWLLESPSPVFFEQLSAQLKGAERKEINRLRFAKDRLIRTYSRALLRQLLARELHVLPQEVAFTRGKYGKPTLASESLHFNVSHSGDFLLFALSKSGPIGIDIEKWKSFDYLQTARTVFSESEQRGLSLLKGEEMKRAFFQGWARKEAFIKAIGQGISFPLKELSVDLSTAQHSSQPIRFQSDVLVGYRLFSLSCPEGYSSAGCFPSDIQEVTFHQKAETFNYALQKE